MDNQQERKPPLTFEERQAQKREAEEKETQERADALRQDYLKRTGRTRMKP